MIVQEKVVIRKRKFMKTYSDAGKMIRKTETGAVYVEALDLEPCSFTYEETDIDIDGEGEDNG